MAFSYLRQLKVPVTKKGLYNRLKENPFYPSLYALSDTFHKFHIENQAYDTGPGDLPDIPAPFIAYIRHAGGTEDFVHVTGLGKDKVRYTTGRTRPVTVSRAAFLAGFRNIVFMAEPDDRSGEDEFVANRRAERSGQRRRMGLTAGAVILFALALGHFILTSGQLIPALWLCATEWAGIFVTLLLLIYEIDRNNAFVRAICTGEGKKDCNAVLNSNAAKWLGISWSETGALYFSTVSLFTLFPSLPFTVRTPYLALIFSIAAGYIPFSLYYQYKVVRQWCPLCLAVQTILASGLLWSLVTFWVPGGAVPWPDVRMLALLLACILLPPVVWFSLRPVLLAAQDRDGSDAAYKRLLHHPDIFNALLLQQPMAADGWEDLGIDIGDPAASVTILKVCNPYCGPCAKAHPVLEKLVEQNPAVRLKIIFSVTGRDTDKRDIAARHLLAIAAKGAAGETRRAVDEWYNTGKRDYAVFAKRYPLNGELKMQDAHIDAMEKWCSAASISFTPTIFINGYRMPEGYHVQELEHIL